MVRPLVQLIPERMRFVTLASSLAKNERPQSMRTLMPEGGRMAAPVTVQSNVAVAVSPLASVTVTVTVFTARRD